MKMQVSILQAQQRGQCTNASTIIIHEADPLLYSLQYCIKVVHVRELTSHGTLCQHIY